jgi:putative ABC transport system permease protein
MPRGFKYPEYATTDFWIPLDTEERVLGDRVPYVEMAARVSGDREAAESAAAVRAAALYQQERAGSSETFSLRPLGGARARNDELRDAMKVLTGAVALILLIAGVNMVNLLLLRGAARARELGVRLALGASRLRLVRQLATEAMLLALLSGVVAAFLAFAALRLLMRIMPSSIVFFAPHAIEVEGRTVLFTFVLAVLSGLLFGLLPALRLARGAAGETLAPHAGSSVPATARLRRGLIATEVAVSVTLLVAAGLLIGSFARLAQVDPGIDASSLTVLSLSVSARDFPEPTDRLTYVNGIREAIERIPGVEATTLTGGLPPRGAGFRFGVVFETEDGESRSYDGLLPTTLAAPDFFAVTGARLLQGRPFRGGDADLGNVIIDDNLAAHLWPGRSAVGRRFRLGDDSPWLTVVGVAAGLKLMGADDRRAQFSLIEPMEANDATRAVIAIRTAGDPRAILPAVRTAVHTINPRQVIGELDTARALYAGSMDMQRFLYIVITALAALALLLTAVGLYGLLAYGVARRQRELGVRVALGARRHDIQRVVLGEGLALAAVGTAAGLLGAAAASRLIEATLYGVEPGDIRTIVAVVGIIFATTVAASMPPARRATRVDPAVVLRAD